MAVTGDVQKPKAAAQPPKKQPKSTKTVAHPPYFEMIKEALVALKERGGSSPHAIAKYMEEKHKAVLPANFRKMLGLQLKNSVAKGKLMKIKASYKLAAAGSAPAEKVKKPPVAAAGTKRKEAKKKVEAGKKKVTPKKSVKKVVKPKQPKSIKSPAAKKAKKVVVVD